MKKEILQSEKVCPKFWNFSSRFLFSEFIAVHFLTLSVSDMSSVDTKPEVKLSEVTQFLPEIYKLIELLNSTNDTAVVNKAVS